MRFLLPNLITGFKNKNRVTSYGHAAKLWPEILRYNGGRNLILRCRDDRNLILRYLDARNLIWKRGHVEKPTEQKQGRSPLNNLPPIASGGIEIEKM